MECEPTVGARLSASILLLISTTLLGWSMKVNTFFSRVVRIQHDRGHHVIKTGPYAFIRHPGNLGIIFYVTSTPVLLGSWIAFIPAMMAAVAVILRCAKEDRTLHAELQGYPEYASEVRYRLLPGVW